MNKIISSNGISLNLYLRGNFNSNNVILVLHGGPGSGAEPLFTLDGFNQFEKDYLVVYFDQRGSGNSLYDLKLGLSIKDITYDVHTVIKYIKETFKDKDLSLLGCSFGGLLGFLYLNNYPNEVQRYIASSPAVYFDDISFNKYFKSSLFTMKDKFPKELQSLIFREDFNCIELSKILSNKTLIDFVYSNACTSKSIKHITAMKDWFFTTRLIETFKNIQVPTLILQGKDDLICPYENISLGYKNYKSNTMDFISFEDCGHSIFEDKPNEFKYEINKFIKGDF